MPEVPLEERSLEVSDHPLNEEEKIPSSDLDEGFYTIRFGP